MQSPEQNLANAIVLQAVEDYRNALNGKSYNRLPPEAVIREIERFFRSDFYRLLTKIDGEWLISKLKQEHREKRKEQLCVSN